MFGRRAPELWAEMTADVSRIDQQVEAQDDLEIRMAMATVRTNVFFESLPQIQYDLWQNLVLAAKTGDRHSMRRVYKRSGCNLQDLLDLLYIADQLAHHNPAVKLENQAFFRILLEFVKDFQGAQLDQVICENLGQNFQPVERHLMSMAGLSQLIHARMDYYVQQASQARTIKNAKVRYERTLDLQGAVYAGLEQVLTLDDKFEHDDAGTYLLLMSDLGMPFDPINVHLVDAIRDVRFLYNHLQYLVGELKKSKGETAHFSSFNGVIASIVQRMHDRGLKFILNTRMAELYNERLLALSRLADANDVNDGVIMELMLDRDNTTRSEQKWEQSKLRQKILKKGILGERAVRLGLRSYFAVPPIYSN